MFCPNCGIQLHEQAVICPRCGYQPRSNDPGYQGSGSYPPVRESNGLAIAALICAFFVPIVGLILGIVGVSKFSNPTYKKMCIWAIVAAIVVWLVNFIVTITVLEPMLEAYMSMLETMI